LRLLKIIKFSPADFNLSDTCQIPAGPMAYNFITRYNNKL
jgi:hypothetical protein